MKVWILTSEYNEYNQYDEYFLAVYKNKPTREQIQKQVNVSEDEAVHILAGGGRRAGEGHWYNLNEEDAK
jgi:hypothetical protein